MSQQARTTLTLLCTIVTLATAASAQVTVGERVTVTQSGQDTLVDITRPEVRKSSKHYPAVTFRPGDCITVTAGGCVQTGGTGDTWKRYVDPRGSNTDKYYHGKIQVPGGTLGLVRLSGVGKAISIPPSFKAGPGQGMILTLGYEDDDYSDNGYWKHDDGNPKQCAIADDGGPAWLKLVIHHGGAGCAPVAAAPFDLTWNAADANGLPLNPRWGKQDDPHAPGLPGQALCSRPWQPPCTTQAPKIMDLPYQLDFFHPLSSLICNHPDGPLGRHVNWGIATYHGAVEWESHSSDDGDYNINVWREDQSLYTQANPNAVHTEFDSEETIDNFSSPWWSRFHNIVDAQLSPGDWINDKDIIEIGVVGLDCAHSCGSEIHPVFVLAIHVKDDPSDDVWAIFARNSGDEGFCSHDSVVAPELSRVYLTLDAREGATHVVPTGSTVWEKTNDQIRINTFPVGSVSKPTGFVVEFDLGDPNGVPMVNGELHLQWTMGAGRIGVSSALKRRRLPAVATRAISGPEPEERYATQVAGLPESSRKKIEQLKSVKPAGPHWIPLHATDLSSPPSDFRSHLGRKPALGRIEVVPNQIKRDYYDKLAPILLEATPPAAPH